MVFISYVGFVDRDDIFMLHFVCHVETSVQSIMSIVMSRMPHPITIPCRVLYYKGLSIPI